MLRALPRLPASADPTYVTFGVSHDPLLGMQAAARCDTVPLEAALVHLASLRFGLPLLAATRLAV